MKGLEGGVEGIYFRDPQGVVVHNGRRKAARNVDDFGWPNWDLFDIERYIELGRPTAHDCVRFPQSEAVVMPVNTARGCVFKCTFCHYVFWHDPYRHRSPESVIAEMTEYNRKYGANYFNFWDELSFHKLAPAEKFVDALLASPLADNAHWTAAVRSDLFGRPDVPREDRERLARKFHDSGCLTLGYSLESGNNEILEAMNKRVKAEYFAEQARLLRDAGIVNSTSLVIGYPQETPETIAETMQMCKDVRLYPSVGFLMPMPETGMWDHAIDHGFITDQDRYLTEMTERQDFIINMTGMATEDLQAEVKTWLKDLNSTFGTGLDDDCLIKTGGMQKHDKFQFEEMKKKTANSDTENRDVDETFNYATVAGAL